MSAPEPVALTEDERELLTLELDAMAPTVPAGGLAGYGALARAADEGLVPAELVPLLERITLVALETGRARRRYSAEGEGVLGRLFRKTPLGRTFHESVADVNRALEVLSDRELHSVRLRVRAPGHFTVSLDAGGVRLTVALRPHAVTVESLEVTEDGPGAGVRQV